MTWLLHQKAAIPKIVSPFRASIFPKPTREVISMICIEFGYDDDETVDEPILGMLGKI
jgi:hypothetical protein